MGAVATAASTLDTDINTMAADLVTFFNAVATSQASNVTQNKPYGNSVLQAPGTAILSKMLTYAGFRSLFASAGVHGLGAAYTKGGIPGNATPTITLATVFAAV